MKLDDTDESPVSCRQLPVAIGMQAGEIQLRPTSRKIIMSYRHILAPLMLLAVTFAMSSQAADKPNILVIWGDDIGITNISAYSDGIMGYRTPNIDRLANATGFRRRIEGGADLVVDMPRADFLEK